MGRSRRPLPRFLSFLFLFLVSNSQALLPANLQSEFVTQHNYWRGEVHPTASNMEALYWSDTLGSAAQAWADLCTFKHSGSSYGENVYYRSGGAPFTSFEGIPIMTVDLWQSEVVDYDYGNGTCDAGKTCGHYTQVVWAVTNAVGCGIAACSPLLNSVGTQMAANAALVICNYNPAGNAYDPNVGKVGRPYIAGPSPPAWATTTSLSRTVVTAGVTGSRTSMQSTSLEVVSTTANAAGPAVASTASTSIRVTTTSYAMLTTSAAATSRASATRSSTVGVVSTTFGASINGGSASTTAASTTTATSSNLSKAPTYMWVVRVTTARCLDLDATIDAWASAAAVSAARLQIVSYLGCSPKRQAGPYILQLMILEDTVGTIAKKVQSVATSLGGQDVLDAEAQIVWLSTVPPDNAPPAPRSAPQLTLVVLVVALAIAAGVILLLAAIVGCLALRKPQSVIVRSEPLLPGNWPQASSSHRSQQLSVLSPPRMSTGYDPASPVRHAPPASPRDMSTYSRLEDDQVLAALYAAAGASNPLARQ